MDSGPDYIVTKIEPGKKLNFLEHDREFCNRVEWSIREARFKLTVKQLRERFRQLQYYAEILRDPELQDNHSQQFLREHEEVLVHLWNHTPRPDLGRRRPLELFMENVARGESCERGKDNPFGSRYTFGPGSRELFDLMKRNRQSPP